jgi:hypothetical protein
MANCRLWHTDLWDHLNYGRQILSTGGIPAEEPLLRLCRGVSMINIPWLAQIAMVAVQDRLGLTALQFCVALLTCGSLSIIAWRGVRMSRTTLGGLLAAALFFKVNLDQFLVIRPQLAGVLFYCCVVAWCFGKRRFSPIVWLGFPLLFAAWANVHGSFSMGLMLLGLTAAGRFGDVLVFSKSLRIAVKDRHLHRLILLTQLCAAAVLLNPAGIAIYPEVMNVAGNSNINSMLEWDALTIRSPQGQSAAAAAFLAIIAIRLSPRRLHCGEMLAFAVTGLLTMWSSRMVNWWGPVAGLVVGVHLTAAIRSTNAWFRSLPAREPSGLWTVVSLGLIWIVFALTPFGVRLIHGRERPLDRIVSEETPVGLTELLKSQDSLPEGVAFVPAEWAGYIMSRGPQSIEPMVNLHVHLIPEQVWNDYIRLMNGPGDWNALMDEYGINLAVVDKMRQPGLFKRLQESSDWTETLQDRQGAVFVRKNRI